MRRRSGHPPGPWAAAVAAVLLMGVLLGCGGEAGAGGDRSSPARTRLVVGFVYVGSVRDHGYNEAAYNGSRAVQRAFPDARILQAEDVPESAEAERVMQRMIDQGARIIFPTSFGHLEPALRVAARNPTVTFLHQGGLRQRRTWGRTSRRSGRRSMRPGRRPDSRRAATGWGLSQRFRSRSRCCRSTPSSWGHGRSTPTRARA